MNPNEVETQVECVRRNELPASALVLKANRVRRVVRFTDTVIKLFLSPRTNVARREARALGRARQLGVPVPELLHAGPDWVATRWIEARPATRDDLERLLPVIEQMHACGILHRDLHLGNCLIAAERVVLLDVQRAIFWPVLPAFLRRRELGQFAYSLGEPLPPALASLRRWRDRRARQHARSRTRRCVVESSRFTRFEAGGQRGFRRREIDPETLQQVLEHLGEAELIWPRPGGEIYRSGEWVVKKHADSRTARAACLAGNGLEVRGFRTAEPLAWVGRWLVMRDATPGIVEWIEAEFPSASSGLPETMMHTLSTLLADMHGRGIYHADMKACNLVWSPGQPLRLLDYEKVLFRRRISRRRRVKNLAQLNSSLPDVVPGALREQAFQEYIERSSFQGDVPRLRRDVVAFSLARNHRWHGC